MERRMYNTKEEQTKQKCDTSSEPFKHSGGKKKKTKPRKKKKSLGVQCGEYITSKRLSWMSNQPKTQERTAQLLP